MKANNTKETQINTQRYRDKAEIVRLLEQLDSEQLAALLARLRKQEGRKDNT